MNSSPVLKVERRGAVTEITLSRPQKRNALNGALNRELSRALQTFDADPTAHVAILTGEDPAFCAGVDLGELATGGLRTDGDEDGARFDLALQSSSKPVIAAVNGAAVTGGLELVLGCDFVIASDRAVFGDSHVRVGVFPGGGMTVLLAQAVGLRMARRMSFTGEFIDAATALRCGLVTEVVAHDQLMARSRAVAEIVAGSDQPLLRAVRTAYSRSVDLPAREARAAERDDSLTWVVPRERLAAGREDVLSQRRQHSTTQEDDS